MFPATYFPVRHFISSYFLGELPASVSPPAVGGGLGSRWLKRYLEGEIDYEPLIELDLSWLDAQLERDQALLRWLEQVRQLGNALARQLDRSLEAAEAKEASEAVLEVIAKLDKFEGEELGEILGITRVLH